ncbi:UNVERIFIED_CONTAM: hypothetical protein FKN15_004778 [Acipenser sinensis]
MDILPSTSSLLDFGDIPHGFESSLLHQLQQLPPFLNPAAPSSSFRCHSISSHLCTLIIQSKDINLVYILTAVSENLDHRVVDCGDLSATLKSRDHHLFSIQPTLTGARSWIRCQELSVRYRGTIFYNYHKAFSAKATAILEADNVIINWATLDMDLFNQIFSRLQDLCFDSPLFIFVPQRSLLQLSHPAASFFSTLYPSCLFHQSYPWLSTPICISIPG